MRQQLTENYINQLSRRDILGLDVATLCGYYSVYESGSVKFPNTEKAPKKCGEDYAQHKNFREWLVGLIEKYKFKAFAIEDVIFAHVMDFRKLCEFRGIVYEVAETYNIPVVAFKPSDVKKWATANGNASKAQMIEYCKKRWHIEPIDDNEADAIHIYMYFVHRYKLK